MTKVHDSLDDFTKDELLAYGEQFGVEVRASMTKAAILAEFQQDGVTFELVTGFKEDTDDERLEAGVQPAAPGELEATASAAEVEDEDDLILVKMTRKNYTYEIRGYRFNREHPYALVKESDADYLIEVDGGFRLASPKEAREFYS